MLNMKIQFWLFTLSFNLIFSQHPDDIHWDDRFVNLGNVNGIYTMIPDGHEHVLVGGDFTQIGGVDAQNLARYHPKTNTWSAVGKSFSSPITNIKRQNQTLFIQTEPPKALNTTGFLDNLVTWDLKTNEIKPIPKPPKSNGVYLTHVSTFDLMGSKVYVYFNSLDSSQLLKSFDFATKSWKDISGSLGASYLIVKDNLVYYESISSNSRSSGFTKYDPATQEYSIFRKYDWLSEVYGEIIATGMTTLTYGSVFSVENATADIFLGGSFTKFASYETKNRVAMYRAADKNWYALGSGLNNDVRALLRVGNDLLVGGKFTTAGGKPAQKFSIWHIPETLTTQPRLPNDESDVSITNERCIPFSWHPVSLLSKVPLHISKSKTEFESNMILGVIIESYKTCVYGLEPNTTYYWRYGYSNGSFSPIWAFKTPDVEALVPKIFAYPNPFSAKITLEFLFLPHEYGHIVIFDLLGKKVKETYFRGIDGGRRVEWDGTDDNGKSLPSGVYIIHLNTSSRHFTRKVVLQRQ